LCRAPDFEEIVEQVLSLRSENGFRVELNAMDRKLAMPRAHYNTFICPGGDLKGSRQTHAVYDQGVIPGSFKGIWQPSEDPGSQVVYRLGLAVHQIRCPGNLPSEHLAYALVTQADSQNRDVPPEIGYHFVRYSCVLGCAWAW
jgi:hypothetical protein